MAVAANTTTFGSAAAIWPPAGNMNINTPDLITTDGANLYFDDFNAGALYRMDLAGNSINLLAPAGSDATTANAIAVDSQNVYWAKTTTIFKASINGGDGAPLVSTQSNVNWLATDGAFVYWTAADGTISRVSPNGSGQTVIARMQGSPQGIALDGQFAYWGGAGGVMKVPLAGGTAIPVAPVKMPGASPWTVRVPTGRTRLPER